MKTDTDTSISAHTYLIFSIVAVLVLGACLVFSVLIIYSSRGVGGGLESAKSYVMVSATGSVQGIPDEEVVYINVNATGATTTAAVDALSSTMASLNGTIYNYTGNMSLAKTTSFSVYKVYNKSYYMAYELLSVTLPNANSTSNFLGAVTRVPNVYVNNVQALFSVGKLNSMREMALHNAIMNATLQAQAVAGGAPVYIGNITINNYGPYYSYFGDGIGSSSGYKSPVVYTGTDSVTASITTTFQYG